jgi:hypothetical protein
LPTLYNSLLDAANLDLKIAAKLLTKDDFSIHSLFYLSKSFEKANKSLLAFMKMEYSKEGERDVETYLIKCGHDKKEIIKNIIKFFKQQYSIHEFDHISENLSKVIEHYKSFKSMDEFTVMVNKDYYFFKVMNSNSGYDIGKYCFLYQKYHENDLYKYRIICYLLNRYFQNIENIVRYPTEENGYTINNPFNRQENKVSIERLLQIMKDWIKIINAIFFQEKPSPKIQLVT